MPLLYGSAAPEGDGVIIEVHLDIMDAPSEFLELLKSLGFEDDPFLEFFPPQYRMHYTGRTRVPRSEVHHALPPLRALVAQVLAAAREAGVRLYAESELVRSICHFEGGGSNRGLRVLDELAFQESPAGAEVKADVHVEFVSGSVPPEVRRLLEAKRFYWVRTPPSERFPSEEIATLQTSTFEGARQVFDRLQASPLPACTGVHLEQKLAMIPSRPDLPMPVVIDVLHGQGRPYPRSMTDGPEGLLE